MRTLHVCVCQTGDRSMQGSPELAQSYNEEFISSSSASSTLPSLAYEPDFPKRIKCLAGFRVF